MLAASTVDQIEVIFEDDGTDEAKAVAAASKLIEQDKVVAIIGATGTGQTMAVRNEIDRAGIPQVSMAGGSAITAKFDPLVFQTPWSNNLVVPFTLAYLKKQGITKIGVITDTGGFGKDGQRGASPPRPPRPGVDDRLEPDVQPRRRRHDRAADQHQELRCAGGGHVDLRQGGGHGRQERQAARADDSRSTAATATRAWSSSQGAGDAAEGFRFAAGKILLPESYGKDTAEYKTATEFVDRYTKAYGAAPSTFAGHAYDALYLIAEAAQAGAGRAHARRASRSDREDEGVLGNRRHVHLLADGPQRSDRARTSTCTRSRTAHGRSLPDVSRIV